MVNALANHGYLPRDGKDISLATLIKGAKEGINLAPDATLLVGLKALQTSSTGNWLSFHLDDLNKHGSAYLFRATSIALISCTKIVDPKSFKLSSTTAALAGKTPTLATTTPSLPKCGRRSPLTLIRTKSPSRPQRSQERAGWLMQQKRILRLS